ncbi:ArsR family transcriptional regulator [Pseudoxanthomonas sp. UTMC 1351]|uniref:VpaChn25_0724 family phage protein n=1 Tax=Pseudoxanthomonas sp. UTMC 1351 TaxID=2695853 RepID=UPI0034CFEC80
MKTFAERLLEDRRLVLLRILSEQLGYKANSSVLAVAMDSFGHSVSRDHVRTQLAWLAEQDLVRLDDLGPVLLATLSERGHDVAQGRVVVPGVARPGA